MFTNSIVSYGENGRDKRYGSNKYRENTDGTIVKDFLDFCEMKFGRPVKTCSDYMVGSGTTKDVCEERGITGTYWDLSMGKNLLDPELEIPDRPETIFFHPPYSSHINIPYAGAEWGAKKEWKKENGRNVCEVTEELDDYIQKYGFDPKEYDLGRMEWPKFIKALNFCVLKMFSAMEAGGRMGILMGDCRRNGKYYSMLLDIAKPGEVEFIVIKQQNNETSRGKSYGRQNFIPISQEYFLILKKLAPYILDFSYTAHAKLDIRDSLDANWKDVVCAVMEEKKRPVSTKEIYMEIEGYRKTQNNPHWKDKVRQTLQFLQKDGITKNTGYGMWAMAA